MATSASPTVVPAGKVMATLAASSLGRIGVTGSSLSALAPLTVVAGGATLGYALLGTTGIPVAYIAIGFALTLFAAGYTAMARKITNTGALYTFITRGIGRITGVAAAFVAVPAYFLMTVGLIGGFGAVASGMVADYLGWNVPWWVFAAVALVVAGFFGTRRIDLNGWVLGILLLGEIIVAVVYAIVQVAHPAGGHVSTEALAPRHLLDGEAGAALVVAITGFVGFESTVAFSEESKDPRRTVPHATYLVLGIGSLLYAGCSWAMSVAAGPDNIVAAAQGDGSELIFTLVQPHVAGPVILFGRLLFLTSLFAATLSFHNIDARYMFALGREGVVWRRLGRTAPKNLAPRAASLTLSVLSAAVVVLYGFAGWNPMINMFFWLTVVAGFGILILLAATTISVLAYFSHSHRRRADYAENGAAGTVIAGATTSTGRPARDVSWWSWPLAPGIAAVLLLVIVVLTVQQFHLMLGVDAHSPLRWVFTAGYAVPALLGAIWASVLRARKSDVYQGIGFGARSPIAQAGEPLVAGVAR